MALKNEILQKHLNLTKKAKKQYSHFKAFDDPDYQKKLATLEMELTTANNNDNLISPKNYSLQNEHKIDTNATQNEHKIDTNATQNRHKCDTNATQNRHKIDTKCDTKCDTTLPIVVSSYINNNKLLTTTALPEEYKTLDFSCLTNIGFGESHVIQIHREHTKKPELTLSPEVIQNSINAFAFDLKHNDISADFKNSPAS